eukprot:IDg794t1
MRVAKESPGRNRTALKFSYAVATIVRRDPSFSSEFGRRGSRKHPLRRRSRRTTRAVSAPNFQLRLVLSKVQTFVSECRVTRTRTVAKDAMEFLRQERLLEYNPEDS